jgi:hypothetical protein
MSLEPEIAITLQLHRLLNKHELRKGMPNELLAPNCQDATANKMPKSKVLQDNLMDLLSPWIQSIIKRDRMLRQITNKIHLIRQ